MANKYIDTISVMQVIGNVLKNPSLLDLDDQYIITEEDFVEDFHKIVFGSIQKIYELGAKKITLESISDFLATRPKYESIYKLNKGDEYLLKAIENAQDTAFNYYYNRMKKMTLLRAYDNFGLNVSFLYDIDNILDTKKRQLQEEWLDNTPLEKIADIIDEKIDKIRIECLANGDFETTQAGEGISELINELIETPEIGLPLYGNFINSIHRGARLKKFYLRSAPTGIGKAIPNNTLIPTPQGMRLVGDIRQGDFVFGQNGKPTKILQVHPQKEEKEIWEITFADGRKAKCCSEHLWEYRYDSHRTKEYRVEDIQTLYNRTLKLKNGLKNADGRGYRFHIRLNEPVQYEEKQFSVDPYIMGLALGDGSFRYNKSNKAFVFSSDDEEMVQSIAKSLNCNFKKSSDHNFGYVFKPKNNIKKNLWVEEIFEQYPELWNVKSEDKFIPEVYMQGSIEQRMSLLQGLLDTDGSINEKGRVSFTTVSPQLRDQIILLVNSLGMIGTYSTDSRVEKYTTGECYDVRIQAKKEMKPKMFRLKRKLDIAIRYSNSTKREEHKDHLAIIDIKPTKIKAEMTCFTVDNKNSLFLMNDYIVTHNTRTMIADACFMSCGRLYDETYGWIKSGSNEPTLYITTEQDLKEVQTLMLAFLSGVDEANILDGLYAPGEEARVREAARIIKEAPLYVAELPDFSLEDIENLIKKNIREHDVSYVFHDYIHTSMKILEEITRKSGGVRLREDNILFMLSIKLKDLCNKYGIFLMSGTQLSAEWKDSKSPDQNLLRGAKAIADKVDFGSILLPVTDQDKESLQPILESGIFEVPDLKLSVYKNRRGAYKGIFLWCSSNLGTCRVNPLFVTTYDYSLQAVKNLQINVEKKKAEI